MDLGRLLNPKSIAVIGGTWADIAARQCRKLGFAGPIARINPRRAAAGEAGYLASVAALEEVPDAAFLAVPSTLTPDVAAELSRRGIGGMVCFAAGFEEMGSGEGCGLAERLLAETGLTPWIGPNCYGFINYFDRVSLWPDEILPQSLDRGVGLISQSGTIAITLSHNQRSLPVGYVVSAGNQARVTVEDLMLHMARDERVSAIGLYLEGVKDAARFIATVEEVRDLGKPIALVKAGRSASAARAVLTHTGSLSGSDAVFGAVCERLGIARCETLAQLCETLKLLHQAGPLAGNRMLLLGASGGDMAMAADLATERTLDLAPLPAAAEQKLRALYGDRLAYANPFDTHVYSWHDHAMLAQQFRALCGAGYDMVCYMLDTPDPAHCDPAAFLAAIDVFIAETGGAGQPACMISSLPELTPRVVRERLLARGLTPLQGLPEALYALDAAARVGAAWRTRRPITVVAAAATGSMLTETAGKAELESAGVPVAPGRLCAVAEAASVAAEIGFPVAVKASAPGLAHKSDAGGVVLDLGSAEQVRRAAEAMGRLGAQVRVEAMIGEGVCEVLVGLVADPRFGLNLVVGAGGVLTEILDDAVTLPLPVDADDVAGALGRLRIAPLLGGFRGRPAGDVAALTSAILAVAAFAEDRPGRIAGLDINPIIVRPEGQGVVAVDATLHTREDQ